ncbi:MAG: hybrid sensor histidine kinase/response regulator [Verrucomicrobiaceae bacterium]|nr:MAG: hybrid sensor histidine kinase/response regulator [Verrucomicrobiaceae bacterium]
MLPRALTVFHEVSRRRNPAEWGSAEQSIASRCPCPLGIMQPNTHFRVLLVDDNPAIHEDFRKILLARQQKDSSLEAAEAILFETPSKSAPRATFELDSAYQGQQALELVMAAVAEGRPYALAFVDVRMPPGWDGVETITRLWKADSALQTVICTAYSDYSWETMSERLGASDNCVILKKPFDNVEVLQLAHAMTRKWQVTQQALLRLETLEAMVTERTRALQNANSALIRSEQRFATAFRASPAPLAIQTVREERFIDVNEAFLRMTGFSREELIGFTSLELHFCIDYESKPSALPGRQNLRHLKAQISTKSGELRQALISIEQITLSGEPHLLLVAEDISERLQLEAQLRQAQKMEAIGQLAAGVAHDFNNLLTIIQGHASLQLALPGHNPDLEASLQQIEQASNRAAELTRQLLAFSRRQIMLPRVIELPEHVRKLSTMLRRLIGEHIEFRCNLPGGLAPICADPTSVEQVVMNLVVNARDAMPRGGRVTLTVSAVSLGLEHCRENPEASLGEFICLSVTDTGTGMDEATRIRIFEPFFTTKEVHKGTGMGLAMVYGITKQHGGWVEVTTAPGCGSTFRVYFPVSEGGLSEKETPPLRSGVPENSHTVLIVEDDHAVRALVKEVLVHNNYAVLEAENADAALAMWPSCRHSVELLLTDMVMPGSANGLELAQQLCVDRPDLKVIYTSGYSTDLFSTDVELQDGVNYLPKPYLSSKLTYMLRNALEPEMTQLRVRG